jgi:hypothetical protein
VHYLQDVLRVLFEQDPAELGQIEQWNEQIINRDNLNPLIRQPPAILGLRGIPVFEVSFAT